MLRRGSPACRFGPSSNSVSGAPQQSCILQQTSPEGHEKSTGSRARAAATHARSPSCAWWSPCGPCELRSARNCTGLSPLRELRVHWQSSARGQLSAADIAVHGRQHFRWTMSREGCLIDSGACAVAGMLLPRGGSRTRLRAHGRLALAARAPVHAHRQPYGGCCEPRSATAAAAG